MGFQEMISHIETTIPHLDGTLNKFKEGHWKVLNCLTHTGTMQLSYQFKNGVMQKKSKLVILKFF